MSVRLDLESLSMGEAIREYLLTMGEGYAYGFWKIWRHIKPRSNYASVHRYFWVLQEIGLILYVRSEPGENRFNRRLYSITEGMEASEFWRDPLSELYPRAALGDKYYAMLEKGLKPKGGRRPKYART